MNEAQANAVYDILVQHAGAPDYDGRDRNWFIYTMATHDCREYRFMGWLGSGGKFYEDARKWRVGCYPQGMTAGRQSIVDFTNAALDELYAKENPHE